MKRRSFLKYSSSAIVPVMLGNMPVFASASSNIEGYEDRILVLIQCNGGNDGLASLVPLDQYDNLANARSSVIIPENQLLPITDRLAFHPELAGLRSMYDNAKLKIIQSVGYPEQNRSHFRSKDIWHSGSASDEIVTSGWIGRYLDETYPGYPNAYPNDEYPDPFAITIGNTVSETCQGPQSNFSMVLSDPERINQISGQQTNTIAQGCAADHLTFINDTIVQSNVYGERMAQAFESGTNASSLYQDDNLSNQLKTIARLIAGGLKTRVYVASLGGFDTHADQVMAGDPSQGEHAQLMKSLGQAIEAFQDDIEKLGFAENVMGMTYSEFGRRIKSNDSYGTDHGDAAPLFIFGNCVDAGILGDNPEIASEVANGEGVPMQFDFRSVYGSMFMDWFGLSQDNISTLIPHDFQKMNIALGCSVVNTKEVMTKESAIAIYPNLTGDFVTISSNQGMKVNLIVMNEIGSVVHSQRTLILEKSTPLQYDLSKFSAGVYFIRMYNEHFQNVKRVVKM